MNKNQFVESDEKLLNSYVILFIIVECKEANCEVHLSSALYLPAL